MTVAKRRVRRKVAPQPPEWQELEDQREWAKVVWYGDPSTGKTTAMAALAHLGPVYFINDEAGLKRGPLTSLGIPVENIKHRVAVTDDELNRVVWDIRSKLDEDPESVIGVCVDSITEVEAAILREIVQDRDMAERDDYNRSSARMRKFIREVRDLPCHVGFSALARRDEDDDGRVIYRPALTPSVASTLMGWVDISVAMQPTVKRDNEEVFWGICRRRGKWQGKDRFRVLPEQLPFPSFDRIVAYINGDIEASTDPAVAAFVDNRERSTNAKASQGKGTVRRQGGVRGA